jgi:hypothetical protein
VPANDPRPLQPNLPYRPVASSTRVFLDSLGPEHRLKPPAPDRQELGSDKARRRYANARNPKGDVANTECVQPEYRDISTVLQFHYRAQLHNADPLTREVGRRQLAALAKAQAQKTDRIAPRIARWVHVPIADLLRKTGNTVLPAGARLQSGHQPVHSSRSGRCLSADPDIGWWWCTGCGTGGDAITLVMSLRGCSYPAAVAWVIERYGRPPAATGHGDGIDA